jgi:SAM-dependent methyltransferase
MSTQDIVAGTCRAYEEAAHEYAMATYDYESYPGLEDEVVRFHSRIPDGFPVLDLGCGGGRDSRLLAASGHKVIAGDICAPMLGCARTLSADYGTAIGYLRLDMRALPFAAGTLGGVWASGSMLHLPPAEIPRALSEILRALVPGGLAAISMRAGESEGWREGGSLKGRRWFTHVTSDGFAAMMSAVGFADVRVRFAGRQNWFVALGREKSAARLDSKNDQ